VSDFTADEPQYELTYFIGECTCPHEDAQHGWGDCGFPVGVDDDGEAVLCECQAGWEE
jgi:hypothetical protein